MRVLQSKTHIFLDSSMVEHSAVNRGVVGSSPTRGVAVRLQSKHAAAKNCPKRISSIRRMQKRKF